MNRGDSDSSGRFARGPDAAALDAVERSVIRQKSETSCSSQKQAAT